MFVTYCFQRIDTLPQQFPLLFLHYSLTFLLCLRRLLSFLPKYLEVSFSIYCIPRAFRRIGIIILQNHLNLNHHLTLLFIFFSFSIIYYHVSIIWWKESNNIHTGKAPATNNSFATTLSSFLVLILAKKHRKSTPLIVRPNLQHELAMNT